MARGTRASRDIAQRDLRQVPGHGFQICDAEPFDYWPAREHGVLSKSKLQMPVMAIGGSGQAGFGTFQADEMKQCTANVEGHVLPGCGHWLPEKCAAQLNPLVVDYVKPFWSPGTMSTSACLWHPTTMPVQAVDRDLT